MSHEADQLFLNTLRDVERRIELEDPYEILGCSALLRKLLIDDYPLVHQVNRDRRLKLRFQIGLPLQFPPGLEPTAWSIQDGLDPATSVPGHATRTVDLDGFLAAKVLASEGKTYTVRELVLFEANVMGGVHAGSPREEKEHVLDSLSRLFQIGGYRVSLRQLKAICRVALKCLAELREATRTTPSLKRVLPPPNNSMEPTRPAAANRVHASIEALAGRLISRPLGRITASSRCR